MNQPVELVMEFDLDRELRIRDVVLIGENNEPAVVMKIEYCTITNKQVVTLELV